MPWIVGIDEAGYGPNLGPFVMTSVAFRVPEALAGADFWQAFRPAVRRFGEPHDGRLLVEDSKLVYSTQRGLLDLETGVLALLAVIGGEEADCLRQVIDRLCPASHADLQAECWYSGTSEIPVQAEKDRWQGAAQQLAQTCTSQEVHWGAIRSVVICPARFNQ
jgi:hypothetical protein